MPRRPAEPDGHRFAADDQIDGLFERGVIVAETPRS